MCVLHVCVCVYVWTRTIEICGKSCSNLKVGLLTLPVCFPDRDGRLRVGDEIINVNGRRLRGVTLEEARRILRHTPAEVDVVVARDPDAPAHESLYSDLDVTSMASGRVDSRVETRVDSRVDSVADDDDASLDALHHPHHHYHSHAFHHGCHHDHAHREEEDEEDEEDEDFERDEPREDDPLNMRGLGRHLESCRSHRGCHRDLPELPATVGGARELPEDPGSARDFHHCCEHEARTYNSCDSRGATREPRDPRKRRRLDSLREEGVVTAVMVRTVSDSSSGENHGPVISPGGLTRSSFCLWFIFYIFFAQILPYREPV